MTLDLFPFSYQPGMISTWNIMCPGGENKSNQNSVCMGNKPHYDGEEKRPAGMIEAYEWGEGNKQGNTPKLGKKGMCTSLLSESDQTDEVTGDFHG